MIVRTWESYNRRLTLVSALAMHPQRNHFEITTNVPDESSQLFIVDHPAPEVIAPIAEVVAPEFDASTGSPFSTTVDQDAPSPSNSQSIPKTQPLGIPVDIEEDNRDIEVTHMSNDPFFGILIPKAISDQSSSTDVICTIVHPNHLISEHNSKWTKD
nr:hypothetical protein [Tanacetum cinerariifolium]